MSAAFGGVDGVGVGIDGFGVSAGPLQGDFQRHRVIGVLHAGLKVDDFLVDDLGFFGGIDEMHVVVQTVFVTVRHRAVPDLGRIRLPVLIPGHEIAFRSHVGAFISEGDAQSLVQESHLLETGSQGFIVKLDRFKNLRIRVKYLDSPGFIGGFAATQRLGDFTPVAELDMPMKTVPLHGGQNPGGQGVYHRNADPVQAAGHRIRRTAELAPRVQNCHDDFHRGAVFTGVFRHRNTAAVISHPHPTVGL